MTTIKTNFHLRYESMLSLISKKVYHFFKITKNILFVSLGVFRYH
jgi:hypothetical protein